MLLYSLTESYFNKNHRIDSRGDSRHIILVRIKVDSCGESAGLFPRNFVGQKNGFNFKFLIFKMGPSLWYISKI